MRTIQQRSAPVPAQLKRIPTVRAGGPVSVVAPASDTPVAPPPAQAALSSLASSIATALKGLFSWLLGLLKVPTAPLPAAASLSGQAPPQAPSAAEAHTLGALPGLDPAIPPAPSGGTTTGSSHQTTLDANLGLVQLNGQTALGGNLTAARGDAFAQATLAMTREATDARIRYQDPTTAVEGHYTRHGDLRSVGGSAAKQFAHSSLGVGGDYNWSPKGDGGQVYGRWQTDAVGETVGGFQVRGGVEAGAMKRPGENWSPYAAGRVSAERENTSLYLEGRRQGGSGFGAPETQVSVGIRMTF